MNLNSSQKTGGQIVKPEFWNIKERYPKNYIPHKRKIGSTLSESR